jgi:hypothetical protein
MFHDKQIVRPLVILTTGMLYIILLLPALVRAQINTYCVCQPSQYTFTVNFTNFACTNFEGLNLTGIRDYFCRASVDRPVGTLQPIRIDTLTITEIDYNDTTIQTVDIVSVPLFPGDQFNYTSYAVTNPANVRNGTIPSSLLFTVEGPNAANATVTDVYRFDFNNNCSEYPILGVGSLLGWIKVVRFLS